MYGLKGDGADDPVPGVVGDCNVEVLTSGGLFVVAGDGIMLEGRALPDIVALDGLLADD